MMGRSSFLAIRLGERLSFLQLGYLAQPLKRQSVMTGSAIVTVGGDTMTASSRRWTRRSPISDWPEASKPSCPRARRLGRNGRSSSPSGARRSPCRSWRPSRPPESDPRPPVSPYSWMSAREQGCRAVDGQMWRGSSSWRFRESAHMRCSTLRNGDRSGSGECCVRSSISSARHDHDPRRFRDPPPA